MLKRNTANRLQAKTLNRQILPASQGHVQGIPDDQPGPAQGDAQAGGADLAGACVGQERPF